MEVAVMGQGKSIRLDRFLAEMKQGTRSQVKEMIRKGRVLVDGIVCRESDRKIFPDETRVTMDGQPVGWADTEYYMLNKPQGVVSATEDGRYQTVIDLIDEAKRKDLFPDASILIRKDCFSSRTTVRWRMSFWHRKNTWIRSILHA